MKYKDGGRGSEKGVPLLREGKGVRFRAVFMRWSP